VDTGNAMALFLETHYLDGRDAETLIRALSESRPGRRCLCHYVAENGRTVEFLVEAEDQALLSATGAHRVTKLFAPVARWLSADPLYPS
jgi:hypothetical protein